MKNTTTLTATPFVTFTEQLTPASDNLLQLAAGIFTQTRDCAVQQCNELAASAPGTPTFVKDAFEETLLDFELGLGELGALKRLLGHALDRVTVRYGIEAGKQLAELNEARTLAGS